MTRTQQLEQDISHAKTPSALAACRDAVKASRVDDAVKRTLLTRIERRERALKKTRRGPVATHANGRRRAAAPEIKPGRGLRGTLADAMAFREDWRYNIPKGTYLYAVERPVRGMNVVRMVHYVARDRTLKRVPPNAGVLAGLDFVREKDGFDFHRGGMSLQDFARKLGEFLHGNPNAYIAADGVL